LKKTKHPGPAAIGQTTLKSAIDCVGVGLHSGARVRMRLEPAPAGSGIRFRRTDMPDAAEIPALWSNVVDTRMCSRIAGPDGASVATIEHLMAALAGAGIDNCRIDIDGPEVPAMDGSAAPFLFLIDCAGIAQLAAPRRAIQVLAPVCVARGDARVEIEPAPVFSIDCAIDFASAAIARQDLAVVVDPATFRGQIARARTFGFAAEVERLRAAGLARGGSLDNAVVIDGDRVINADGLRFDDEFVRHKVLDAVGDFYLAGAPLLAHVRSRRGGHELNNLALRALFERPDAWRDVEMTEPVRTLGSSGSRMVAG
jgi:UDP-3-O-[3-hydroxymyristoyl] N-acetylglucosamine deacetylase